MSIRKSSKNRDSSFRQNSVDKEFIAQHELWSGERNLENYNNDLVLKIMRTRTDAKDILEFGARLGTLSVKWAQKTGIIPDVIEVDPELMKILEQRGFHCCQSLDSINKSYDLIFTSNVLEHIEDDVTILHDLFLHTNDGGQLVVYVPAFQFLYSRLDEKAGHFRRYSKKDLVKKLITAGWVVSKCHYSDSLGYFAWLSTKMMGSTEDGTNERKLLIYDRYIFPISKALDALGLKYIFGKNIIVWCRK